MDFENEQDIEDAGIEEAAEDSESIEETYSDEPIKEIDSESEAPSEKAAIRQKPALTITIQSWATPVIGLLMLVLGLAGGFYGRPYVFPQTTPAPTTDPTAPTTGETSSTNPQPNVASPENREAFVAEVVSRVRHFRGDPNAPITLIEFSDFQ